MGIGQVFAGRQQEAQEKVGVVRLVCCQPPSLVYIQLFSLLYIVTDMPIPLTVPSSFHSRVSNGSRYRHIMSAMFFLA